MIASQARAVVARLRSLPWPVGCKADAGVVAGDNVRLTLSAGGRDESYLLTVPLGVEGEEDFLFRAAEMAHAAFWGEHLSWKDCIELTPEWLVAARELIHIRGGRKGPKSLALDLVSNLEFDAIPVPGVTVFDRDAVCLRWGVGVRAVEVVCESRWRYTAYRHEEVHGEPVVVRRPTCLVKGASGHDFWGFARESVRWALQRTGCGRDEMERLCEVGRSKPR